MVALSQNYNSNHSLNMLARFELIKKRQAAPEDDESGLEVRLQSLATQQLITNQVPIQSFSSKLIQTLIGGVEFILGKKKVKIDLPPDMLKELEVAYFYERARKYEKAIEVYKSRLSDTHLTEGLQATLVLHIGFCTSVLGQYDPAIVQFKKVIDLVPGSEDAHVAQKLIDILKGLQDQIREARALPQTPFSQGRQMFFLANYQEAIKILEQVVADEKTIPSEVLEGDYLIGRSQEEMGMENEAVQKYRQIIAQNPNSNTAKKANRRLYLLGKIYVNDSDLTKAALKKIEQYQDFKFINTLKSLDDSKPKETRAGMVSHEANSLQEYKVAKMENLEDIQIADLRGQDKKTKGDKDEEVKVAALQLENKLKPTIAPPKHVAAKIHADPMRQESIFATIENNHGELEFVYQKWLRKGQAFEGQITVRMLVDPKGEVKDAKIVNEKSTITNEGFNSEILRNIKHWKFREDPGSNVDIPVSFPVQFVQKQ